MYYVAKLHCCAQTDAILVFAKVTTARNFIVYAKKNFLIRELYVYYATCVIDLAFFMFRYCYCLCIRWGRVNKDVNIYFRGTRTTEEIDVKA